MSRGDAWSVAVTLAATGIGYFVSGPKTAWGCLILGVLIALFLHFSAAHKDAGAEKTAAPVIKDSFNPQFEANPQIHLHLNEPERTPKPFVASVMPPQKPDKPNLQCRRAYPKRMWVGHEISGRNIDALVAEIGNELGEKVGKANGIRTHLTYKGGDEILQVICPAQWERDGYDVYLKPGESENVVLAINMGEWFSREYDGINLKTCSEIQLRLLDGGSTVLGEAIIFDCSFKDSWHHPICKIRPHHP